MSGRDGMFDDNSQKAYFDYLRNRSKLSFFFRGFFFQAPARALSGRILDVGCGIAEFSRYCRGEYLGVDPNPYLVQYNLGRGLNCQEGKAEQLPFEDECFDSVLITHVLEHLDRPETALRQIYRVLKPGGLLFAAVPMRAGFRRDSTHRFYFDRSALDQKIRESVFQIHRLWAFPFDLEFFGDWLYFNELRVLAQKPNAS